MQKTMLSRALACALMGFGGNALAQSVDADKRMDTVVVTDRAVSPEFQEGNVLNPFRTAASSAGHVQIITREEIEQSRASDPFELLNMATGVVVAPASPRMGFSSLSIRGDTNFRWMIDGVYLDFRTAERVMRSIPVFAIEEVKIVRGASALTLGPMTNTENPTGGAATNGFIVVRTRKPTGNEGKLRLAVESNHGEDQSLWLGRDLTSSESGTKGYVGLLASHMKRGSPEELLYTGIGSDYVGYNVDRQFSNGMVKFGYTLAGWQLAYTAYQDEGRYQIPNANSHYSSSGFSSSYYSWKVDPSRTTFHGLSGSRTWNDRHVTLFSMSALGSRQTVFSGSGGVTQNTPNEQNAEHLNVKHVASTSVAQITGGFDYRHLDVPYGQNPAFYPGTHVENETYGWFVQAERSFLGDKLKTDASYRRDRVHEIRGLNVDFLAGPSAGSTTNRWLPNAQFLSLGGQYQLSPTWQILARYGYSQQPASPGAMPVTGVTLGDDIQNKFEVGAQGALSRFLTVGLNYFAKKTENEKYASSYHNGNGVCSTYSEGSREIPCYRQGDSIREGLELSLSGAYSVRGTYKLTWTHFTNLSGDRRLRASGANVVTASPEATTPRNTAEFSVTQGMGRYTLNGAVKFVSNYFGIANGELSTGAYAGYTRYDLGVGYDWKVGGTPLRTSVYGKNLTDERYETSAGVPDVGRVMGIELLVSF